MHTALPIPAFARYRARRASKLLGARMDLVVLDDVSLAIDRRTADKLDWLFAAHPDAKIALVTTIPPAPSWHDLEA
jgi:ABC-type transport system involved in cytochrome c biogenesis ATPase subunit